LEAARKRLEERQIAEHKRQMAERRSAFEKQFRNVWATGDTGISQVQYTMTDHTAADDLIGKLFYNTLIADVEKHASPETQRTYLKDGKMVVDQISSFLRLIMLTSDDRVAELIEEVAASTSNTTYPAFDMVVTPIATGSKSYIEWVQTQTLKKEPETAFFNINADPALKALESKVPDMAMTELDSTMETSQESAQEEEDEEEDEE